MLWKVKIFWWNDLMITQNPVNKLDISLDNKGSQRLALFPCGSPHEREEPLSSTLAYHSVDKLKIILKAILLHSSVHMTTMRMPWEFWHWLQQSWKRLFTMILNSYWATAALHLQISHFADAFSCIALTIVISSIKISQWWLKRNQ